MATIHGTINPTTSFPIREFYKTDTRDAFAPSWLSYRDITVIELRKQAQYWYWNWAFFPSVLDADGQRYVLTVDQQILGPNDEPLPDDQKFAVAALKPHVRIATHQRPDLDAVVWLWLQQRFIWKWYAVDVILLPENQSYTIQQQHAAGVFAVGGCGGICDEPNGRYDHQDVSATYLLYNDMIVEMTREEQIRRGKLDKKSLDGSPDELKVAQLLPLRPLVALTNALHTGNGEEALVKHHRQKGLYAQWKALIDQGAEDTTVIAQIFEKLDQLAAKGNWQSALAGK